MLGWFVCLTVPMVTASKLLVWEVYKAFSESFSHGIFLNELCYVWMDWVGIEGRWCVGGMGVIC